MVNIAPCTWGSKGLPFLLSQPVFYMPGPLSNSLLRSSLYIDMCNRSTIPGSRLEQLSSMCKCCLSLSQGIYSQLKVTSTDFWDLLLPATTWLHCEDRWCHAMHRQGAAPFLSLQDFGGGATWLSPFISGMVTKARGPWPLKWISAAIRKRAQSFLKIILIYLFIYDRAGSLLLHRLFSTFGKWGRLSGCGSVQGSHWGGFSCCGARASGMGVAVACGLRGCSSQALGHRLGSYGTRA